MSTQHVTRQERQEREKKQIWHDGMFHSQNGSLLGTARNETNLYLFHPSPLSATRPINEGEPNRAISISQPGRLFWPSMPFLSAVGIKFAVPAAGQGTGRERDGAGTPRKRQRQGCNYIWV